jgi:hypothetical protein
MSQTKHKPKHLLRDALLILVSITVAVLLIKLGLVRNFIGSYQELYVLSSFTAGIFFTSLFTIAPASVALAEISQQTSMLTVAFWGALGAVVGDLILFLFIRDSLADDIMELIRDTQLSKLQRLFKLRIFRFLIPFLGALVIASPLPDEIGLAMMGLSRMHVKVLVPVSFAMNFLGIVLVALAAQAL